MWFHFGHFLQGLSLLPFAFVCMGSDGDGRSNVSISKFSGIIGMLSIMLCLVYLRCNWFLCHARVALQLEHYKQIFLFFWRWYVVPNLGVQAWSFLWELVCLLWKFVSRNCKCLAFVVVYVDIKRPVWSKAFIPLRAFAGDMLFFTAPFSVVRYERRNACSISSVVVLFPFALSGARLNVSTKRSAWPLDCGW